MLTPENERGPTNPYPPKIHLNPVISDSQDPSKDQVHWVAWSDLELYASKNSAVGARKKIDVGHPESIPGHFMIHF